VQIRTDKESNEIYTSDSRLDRISVVTTQFKRYRGWDIKHCPVKSDHRLVVTQLTCNPDEEPGNGRWSMPLYLLKSAKFMNRVRKLAYQLVKDVETLQVSERSPTKNNQILWAKFKSDVTDHGKYCLRFIMNETTRQVRTWKTQLDIVIHNNDRTREDRSLAAYFIEKKIADRLRAEAEKNGKLSERRYDVEGETLQTTAWTRSAKGYHPHKDDTLFRSGRPTGLNIRSSPDVVKTSPSF
jgi:hypothetical protein